MHILPDIIEQVGRSKKTFSIPTKLYEKSIITLTDAIDDDLAYTIITQLLYLDSVETEEDIKLYINSPGGVVTAGLAIIDTMNAMRRKVQTIGMGSCASMGAMILLSGTGERKILKNTRVMLHSISGGFVGNFHDHKVNFKETEILQDLLMQMISDKTKMTTDEVKKNTERDMFMSATECKHFGLVDSIV